jgi:hypothetical protein
VTIRVRAVAKGYTLSSNPCPYRSPRHDFKLPIIKEEGMKELGIILILLLGFTFLVSVIPASQPPCTTQRITILEKDLEIEKLSNDLALLTHKIEKLQTNSKTQGEELGKLRSFITIVGGEGGEPLI